jgi:hypothetical protein
VFLVQVAALQEKYLHLSKKYMMWRYGPRNARLTYPKLLMKLVDLQSLNDNRNEGHILLNQEEIMQIQKSLGNLCVDTFKRREQQAGAGQTSQTSSTGVSSSARGSSTSSAGGFGHTARPARVNATGVTSSLQQYLMGEADSITNFLAQEEDGVDEFTDDRHRCRSKTILINHFFLYCPFMPVACYACILEDERDFSSEDGCSHKLWMCR